MFWYKVNFWLKAPAFMLQNWPLDYMDDTDLIKYKVLEVCNTIDMTHFYLMRLPFVTWTTDK